MCEPVIPVHHLQKAMIGNLLQLLIPTWKLMDLFSPPMLFVFSYIRTVIAHNSTTTVARKSHLLDFLHLLPSVFVSSLAGR